MKPIKLRCKDTVKKLPKVIPPNKGKKSNYKRKKDVEIE
jgi:hypothetical protein